jgi:hypothetical protein
MTRTLHTPNPQCLPPPPQIFFTPHPHVPPQPGPRGQRTRPATEQASDGAAEPDAGEAHATSDGAADQASDGEAEPEGGSRGAKPALAWGVGREPHKTPGTSTARALRGHGPSIEWRCRESNPGPLSPYQGFSVCSPLCLCSAPPFPWTRRCDGPSRCGCPAVPRDRVLRFSLLADAGYRVGGDPGPTDSLRLLRQRERSQRDC